MRGARPFVWFVTRVVLIFVALLWVTSTGFYPSLFRATANFVFQELGSGRIAKFEPFADPRGVFDTTMLVGTNALGSPMFPSSLGLNSVRQGLVPTVLLVALFIATPIPWRKKLWGLAAGLLLVHCFVALRIAGSLLHGFARLRLDGHPLLDVGTLGAWVLRRTHQIMSVDLHITYLAPLAIWLAVTASMYDVRLLWRGPDVDPPSADG